MNETSGINKSNHISEESFPGIARERVEVVRLHEGTGDVQGIGYYSGAILDLGLR